MKRFLVVSIGFVVVLLTVFVLAGTGPVLDRVKQMAEEAVEENLGIPLAIGSLRGHLLFSLCAEDIQSPGLGNINELRLTYNPLQLLNRHLDIRSARITGINIDIDRLRSMLDNLPEKPKQDKAEKSQLKVEIGEFTISSGGVSMKLGDSLISASLQARGSMLSDRLIIDSLHLSIGRSIAVVRGVVPFVRNIELDLAYSISLGTCDAGVREMRGNLFTTGTFNGLYSSPLIEAETNVDAWISSNHIVGMVKSRWRIPYLDSMTVKGRLVCVTPSLERGTSIFDTLEIGIDLQDAGLSADIVSRYGRLATVGQLQGSLARLYFGGTVTGQFDYAGFNPSLRGTISYGDNVFRVSDLEFVSRRVSAELGLGIDLKKKMISEARLILSCSDLSVVNCFLRGPEDISGTLLFELNVNGSLDNPRGEARLRLSDATIYGERITQAKADFSVANGIFTLDQGTIESGRGELYVTGSYDSKNGSFTAGVRGDTITIRSPEILGKDTLLVSGEIGLDAVFSGYVDNPVGTGRIHLRNVSYDTLNFGHYRLDFSLEDTVLVVSLENEARSLTVLGKVFLFDTYPYDVALKMEHFELDEYLEPATGFMTADVSMSGELMHVTKTKATSRVDTIFLLFGEKPVQNANPLMVHLEDRMISIQPTELSIAGQSVFLQGSMPLDLRSGSFDLWARSSTIELSSIAHLIPTNPPIEGILEFDIHVQGMPKAIDIDGRLVFTNARYETKYVLIDSVNCILGFKNGVATVENFHGRMNTGRFGIRGFVNLAQGQVDSILLAANLSKAVYSDKSFGRVVLSAEMQMSGRRDSLRIDGEVVVNEAVYDAPIRLQTVIGMLTAANRPVPEQSEMLKRIYCDIGISVPDSVRIANNVANLTAKADLEVKGYLARPNAYGTIIAIGDGSVQYLGKKFEILNAIVQFDDPYKIDPVIDLSATTSIAAADADYDVYLLLNGTVTTWQLRLSSNPPLPEQDIMSLLLIGQRRPGEVAGLSKDVDLRGKAKDYALDAIRHGLEKTTQDFLGLDKFTLTGDLSDPLTVRVGVEKSITKGFKLIYSTGVESWELHQIGASYDLTDHISIFTLHDQENLNTSVDLDFHLEIR